MIPKADNGGRKRLFGSAEEYGLGLKEVLLHLVSGLVPQLEV